MATVTGKVSKIRKDRKGLCIDDVWYSGYKPSYIGEAQVGDTVTFTYTEKGDWKNITEDTLTIGAKGGGSAPSSGGSSSSSGGGGGGGSNQFRSVPQLVRTDAVTQALKLIETQGFIYNTGKQALRATLYFANVIAAYVNAEIDVDDAELPKAAQELIGAAEPAKSTVTHTAVPDPAPPAAAEVPAASPAPSLDKFMDD